MQGTTTLNDNSCSRKVLSVFGPENLYQLKRNKNFFYYIYLVPFFLFPWLDSPCGPRPPSL